jgi:hypothetical protein
MLNFCAISDGFGRNFFIKTIKFIHPNAIIIYLCEVMWMSSQFFNPCTFLKNL